MEGRAWVLPERAMFLECQAHKNNQQYSILFVRKLYTDLIQENKGFAT